MKLKICCNPNCKKEYIPNTGNVKYCSLECRKEVYFNKKQERLKSGVEGEDYVIDLWTGNATPRIFGKYMLLYHPNKTSEEYRKEFPGAKLVCSKISSQHGQFMKEEKHRKRQSELIKGSNNPNHRSKTTEEHRKSISPFSKSFKGYKSEEDRNKFIQSINRVDKFENQKGYWIKKGFSEEEAKQKVKERQRTFTLEKCIVKLGEKEGTERWKARQLQWSNSHQKRSYSLVSQELFKEIFNNLSQEDQSNCKFAQWDSENKQFIEKGRNFEQRIFIKDKMFLPDFILNDKIIEFDGEYWHGKYKQMTGNSDRDKIRDSYLIEDNYKILHIKERDYYQDKNKIIDLCLQFLKKN